MNGLLYSIMTPPVWANLLFCFLKYLPYRKPKGIMAYILPFNLARCICMKFPTFFLNLLA